MEIASFGVAIVAILISAGGLYVAVRSDRSARASADAAARSAVAAEGTLSVERRKLHEDLRPHPTGKVDSFNGRDSYRLLITLPADACRLTAMEVAIRKGQGVSFSRDIKGVVPVNGSADFPLRAFAYDRQGSPMGLLPGETAQWSTEVAEKHESSIWVDATCHTEDGDHWTWPVKAKVTSRLMNTVGEPS